MYDLGALNKAEWAALIEREARGPSGALLRAADQARLPYYGHRVFFRGLVEFSNVCRMDCYYCGLRRGNKGVRRYRLSPEEILCCVRAGRERGFHSFVLQGGEDGVYNGGQMVNVVERIKAEFPGAALTLSMGELPPEMYKRLRQAGADRYLLRHETADAAHFARLHPPAQTLDSRKRCLFALKELGFQVGAGFMAGSPGQTFETLAQDMLFLKALQPEMVGIGPFLPQSDTPFAGEPPGSLSLTLTMLALVRLLLPQAMLPATTALGTLVPGGRELGLRAGANVVMPNLTPTERRGDYLLYDGKIGIDSGVDEGLRQIMDSVAVAGFTPDFGRGDHCRLGEPRLNTPRNPA